MRYCDRWRACSVSGVSAELKRVKVNGRHRGFPECRIAGRLSATQRPKWERSGCVFPCPVKGQNFRPVDVKFAPPSSRHIEHSDFIDAILWRLDSRTGEYFGNSPACQMLFHAWKRSINLPKLVRSRSLEARHVSSNILVTFKTGGAES